MEHCREDSEMRLRNISVAQKLWSTMAPDLTLSTKAANFCAERCAFGPVVSSEFRKWASMKLRVDSKVTTPQSPISHEAGALATLWAVRGPDHDRPKDPHFVERNRRRPCPRVPERKTRPVRAAREQRESTASAGGRSLGGSANSLVHRRIHGRNAPSYDSNREKDLETRSFRIQKYQLPTEWACGRHYCSSTRGVRGNVRTVGFLLSPSTFHAPFWHCRATIYEPSHPHLSTGSHRRRDAHRYFRRVRVVFVGDRRCGWGEPGWRRCTTYGPKWRRCN